MSTLATFGLVLVGKVADGLLVVVGLVRRICVFNGVVASLVQLGGVLQLTVLGKKIWATNIPLPWVL